MSQVYSAGSEANAVAEWLAAVASGRRDADAALIRQACELAHEAHRGQVRASGEPFVAHALGVARILADLKLDHETIAAALLLDVVEDTRVALEEIERRFGTGVARLVEGVTRMDAIRGIGAPPAGREAYAQAEGLRKMLLAMAEDVRVVLIKLADRLHNMRTLGALAEERQRRIARETMDIYAPLANRLGIWQIKWELEDQAFRYLEPQAYKQIAALLAEKRADREQYIARFIEQLQHALAAPGISAEVSGRPKHIYGIWRKMQRKGIDFERITDVRAVRVLVSEVGDCYAALGVVHTLWRHIPGEFDDYIATPKQNQYRSIHTAVVGPAGKTVEVQIRTHEMHRQSELGVAAHWRYKEGAPLDAGFDRKIAWLRSLLAWKDDVAEAAAFVDRFKSEVFSERVYVFTPKGRIIDLPAGATPLDFAYHVHTDIGHRCRGAKVNGHIVPLTYSLKTGEQIEVLTVKEGGPSRDWLNPHLGYLQTSKARAKVQQWLRQQNHELSVSEGRALLERELRRLALADVNYVQLAHAFGSAKVDDFLAALGRGEVKPSQIVAALQQVEPRAPAAPPLPAAPARTPSVSGISIQGVGNLLTRLGRCCNPVPGEAIVGFVTHGHGITIHRRDCINALRHHGENDERLLEVSWGSEAGKTYPVDVEITAYERRGLLRDITALLANEKINVIAVNTSTDKSRDVAHMTFTLEVADLDALARVLALIDQIPNVAEVRRRSS